MAFTTARKIFQIKLNSFVNETFSSEIDFWLFKIHIYIHSRDYLKKTSVKINVATDEGNSRNEIEH